MIQRFSSASPYEHEIGFCRALRVGDRILVSGTAPIGPDGRTVEGDVEQQARRCFTIIGEAVRALGGAQACVVRTRMLLTARDDWEAAGRAHGDFYRNAPPAATMVVVQGLLDPAWRLEVEAEAVVLDKGPLPIQVREARDEDRTWIAERSARLFGGTVVISRGRAWEPSRLPAFVAIANGERAGLATWRVEAEECELVTIDAWKQWQGIGTHLLAAVENAAKASGCKRLWLITTNDNVDALRFYQRRGYRLCALHADALRRSRELKPSIPALGSYDIPIRDELELEKLL